MRLTVFLPVLVAGLTLPTAAAAQSAEDGWYVAASGTLSLLDDSHTFIVDLPIPTGYAETEYKMDAGWGAQVAVGRQFDRVRLEVEGGYTKNTADHYEAIVPPTGDIPAEGGHKTWRVMANGYYDFGEGNFRPYIGGGVGYAEVKGRLFAARAPFPDEEPMLILNDRTGELAYQAMAGASVGVSDSVSLTAQYRWFSVGKAHFTDLGGYEHIREHHGHNLDVGLRIRL
ncbi:outer membrane protein [Croceicoccus bisphenolivorans]|uniref:outer membrane protein n=1 Tax=Croceicoccus bisphenolivorans TaxID=1783232 RepID=UPI0009EE76F9|nr:outer membrane beta-barrel protein [Croceicoccus bisphenolivorans]